MLFNTWIPLRSNNYITAYVFLYQQAGYRIHRLTGMVVYYPPGSKCEALRLGVHLILLYFIRILVVGTEIIFLFGWWLVFHFFCLSLASSSLIKKLLIFLCPFHHFFLFLINKVYFKTLKVKSGMRSKCSECLLLFVTQRVPEFYF